MERNRKNGDRGGRRDGARILLALWVLLLGLRGVANVDGAAAMLPLGDAPDDPVATMTLPGGLHAVVDATAEPGRVWFYLPDDSDFAALTPVIRLPEGAEIQPAPATITDFSRPVTYAIRYRDRTRSWQVKVYRAALETGLSLDGVGAYVEIPTGFGVFDGLQPFTIELWLTPRSLPAQDDWTVAPVPVSLLGERNLRLTTADGSRSPDRLGVRAELEGAGWRTPVDSNPLALDTPVHVAASFCPDEGWTLYQNGVETASNATTRGIRAASGRGNFLGGEPGTGRGKFVKGILRDVRFWSIVRDETAIRETMHRALSGAEEGLVAYWPLNEGEGEMARDLSPHERHGTVIDGRWALISVRVLEPEGSPSIEGLRALLPGRDDVDTRTIMAAIGAVGDEAAVEALNERARHGLPVERIAALGVLGAMETVEDLQALEVALDDAEPGVRDAAAQAWVVKATQEHDEVASATRQALIRIMADPEAGERRSVAARLLGELRVVEAAPVLLAAVDAAATPEETVIVALEALGHILVGRADRPVVLALAARLDDERKAVRDAAAIALGRIGGDDALGILERTAYADWPMWGYDARRSGASPLLLSDADSAPIVHLYWKREMPAPRRAWPKQLDDKDKLEFDLSYTPVAMGGRLFVASMTRDRLTAYDLDTGEELWRFYAEGPARVAPAAWEGRVYFASDDGHLYCLDAATGERLWAFDARPTDHRALGNDRIISFWPARGAPVVEDGVVYFAAGIWPFLGTFIHALDATTGAVRWSNTGHATEWQRQPHGGAYSFAGVAPQGYLAVSGDRLVVSGGRAMPALFDRRDGSLLHSLVDGKDVGGYRVRIQGEYYYNHGRRYRLADGEAEGDGRLDPALLARRVEAVADPLDDEVFEAFPVRDRLLVTTRRGTIYCFGREPRAQPTTHREETRSAGDDIGIPSGGMAETLLPHLPGDGGYVLVLGAGDGTLLEQLVHHGAARVVAIEPDAGKVEALRRRFDDAGLYGDRIALITGEPSRAHYPSYISSLVVLEDLRVLDGLPDAAFLERVYAWLRPYTGRAVLRVDGAAQRQAFQAALDALEPVHGQADLGEPSLVLSRTGALPGAGAWTHQYADSAQRVMSGDRVVRPPFGPIWFGGTTNMDILPRHALGPRPQVSGGRLVILGVEDLVGRCVFTGREIWKRSFPGIGHPFTNLRLEAQWRAGASVYMTNQPGSAYIGSPYVTLADAVYVRYQGRVYRLDPERGEPLDVWDLPALPENEEIVDWGHISVCGDVLLATTNPYVFRGGALGTESDDRWDGTSSRQLVAMNRHTGEVLWTREATIGFRHNAIASARNRVFVNDLLTEEAVGMARRRGIPLADRPRLSAFDLHSAAPLWQVESEVFGTFLSYSEEHDILVEGGSRDTRRVLSDEPSSLIARRGADGTVLWKRDEQHQGPLVIHGDSLIPGRPGPAICLLTGDNLRRTHPITGEETDWSYWKAYGCGMSNAGEHLLLFRSGSAGFTDLEQDGGTGTLGGFKSGCTASMIPADGILNAPDYTRTCNCSYQNQTSLGLIHMPEMELWTVNEPIRQMQGSMQRLGINFGAPGDRRAANGTLWIAHPRGGTPGPQLEITWQDNPAFFRKHSLWVEATEGYPWVAASGVTHAGRLVLPNIHGDGRPHTLTFHLAEPDGAGPGERVFDLWVDGELRAEGVDIAARAGGGDRALTMTFTGLPVGEALAMELRPHPTSSLPPVLGGLELHRETPENP